MQTNFIMIRQEIKDLLNIYGSIVKLESYEFTHDSLFVYVSTNRNYEVCPVCGDRTNEIHDYYMRTINHGRFNNYDCFIKYNQRRYRCSCGKRFSVQVDFVEKFNKISSNSKLSVIKECEAVSSFKNVAYKLNMSSTSVRRLFNKHCDQVRGVLPRVMSIDEFKGNTDGNRFNLSICDPSNRSIIDILPNRFKSDLLEYFGTFTKLELNNVEVVTMDMYHVYYDVVKQVFPKAAIVIDPFHFVRLVTTASNNVRIRTMKGLKKSSKGYKLLKSRWRLFLTKETKISETLRFNKYKHEWESSSHTLDIIRNIHPELNKARELLESFYTIVHGSKYPMVHHDLTNWIVQAKLSNIGELREAALSIERWLIEICNSFMINPDTDTRYSSAFIEGTNNFIKVIKRTSYGFRCFKTFRNKILYNHRNSRRVIKA